MLTCLSRSFHRRTITSNALRLLPHLLHLPFDTRHLHTSPPHAPPRPPPRRPASAYNLPNALTVTRLIAAPLTGHLILSENYGLALATLTYAAATDWLDGYLARRLHLQTVIGSYLDPAADKLLISITTISLAYQSLIPAYLACLIISRDIGLIAAFCLLPTSSQPLNVLPISKMNTAVQLTFTASTLLNAAFPSLLSPVTLPTLGLFTAITTTSSTVSYIRQSTRTYASNVRSPPETPSRQAPPPPKSHT